VHFATALLLTAAVVQQPVQGQRTVDAQRAPAETPRIGEITFEGADATSLRALVPIQPGAPFDARDVRDAVRALHGTARFSRVEAYLEPMEAPSGADAGTPIGGDAGAPYARLIFVLVPVEKLVAVAFPGHEALSESALHQTANLQVNAEYLPEQVPKAVKDLLTAYERIGYRQARITPATRSVPGGVELSFQIDEGPPTRITAIDFEGQPGLDKDELLAAFRLRPGDILNLSAVEEGIRGLRERYRKANRLRAKVETPHIEEVAGLARVRLIVPVAAGPVVRFHVRGNRAFDDAVLDSHLFGESEEQLDAQVAQEMVARLRRFYVAAGFLRVRVAEREMQTDEGAVDVVFSVDEGPQVRVEKIVFQGNDGISSRQLRERLLLLLRDNISRDPSPGADPTEVARTGIEGRLRGLPEPRTKVDPETVYDPALYSRALKQIEDLYKSQGYLSARAGPPKLDSLDSTGKRLQVTIPIDEGEQTRVGRIVVEGGGDVPRHEIDSAITLRVGQPFSYLAAEEGRSALTQIYTRRGHLYARVEDEETFVDDPAAPSASRMEVRYRIQPGPVVRVAYIEVVGQRRTLEGLILDLAGLKPGEVLTPEVMDRGQQALIGTGLFFSATLTPRNPEVVESEKTVQIQVRERPTRDFQASLGFSLADGPRATAQYTRANLWGRNLTFSVVGRVNFPFGRFPTRLDCPPGVSNAGQCDSHIIFPTETLFGGRSFEDPIERVIDIGLSAPRLWPLTDELRAGVDLIQQRVLEPSYTLTKYSAQLSTALTQRRPFTASLAYEVGFQEFSIGQTSVEQVLAGQDQRILRTPPGQMTFGSLRPQLLFDLRDDPARPRSGMLAEFDGDFEHSFAGSASGQDTGGLNRIHVNLFRAEGQLAVYLPLPFLSSIVLSARGGRVFQLDSLSSTPGDRRFYLGGATSLRGFHEDAVQPQDLINRLHAIVNACATTLSGVACSVQAQLLAAGATSAGGDQFAAFTAELRVPVARSVEVAGFYDGGNLWQAPTDILNNFVLRSAVGGGLRWVTPIGRLAVDIGVNLDPDVLLGEPRFGPYFSIDPL
jgi:outer membrane protein assembly factor BamA